MNHIFAQKIKINHHLFIEKIKEDFDSYIADLRNEEGIGLRKSFDLMFSVT